MSPASNVGTEDHGDHLPTTSVPGEPSSKFSIQADAGGGILSDRSEEVVDLVQPPFGRRKVTVGDLEDVVEDSDYVATDVRMANLTHHC